MDPSPLLARLNVALGALERNSIEEAASAIDAVVQACDQITRRGELLPPALLRETMALYQRCVAAAAAANERLRGSLGEAGTTRRAIRAYENS